MNKKFLYILSPSFASYIQWKPIITKIRNNNNEIEFLLPKPLDYKNIIPSLREELKGINSQYIYFYGNPLCPFFINKGNFNYFENVVNSPKFNYLLKIRNLFSRVEYKLRIVFLYSLFGNIIRRICSSKLIRFLYFKIIFNKRWDYVLYDVFEERKLYFYSLLPIVYSIPRFSLYHGIDLSTTHSLERMFWVYKSNLMLLDYTGKNKSLYKKFFKLNDKNYKIIGIPKHNNSIKSGCNEELKKELINENQLSSNVKFITLASRPSDYINYCHPFSRKIYLETIGQFLNKNNKYHLLIKTHPKEKDLPRDYWSSILKLEDNSNKFSLTNIDMLKLASISHFGFCFYSSSCIDFAFMGKPMIEMTSLNDTLFGEITTAFDQEGNALTGFSTNALAININSPKKLSELLENLENSYNEIKKVVSQGYENCFGKIQYTSKIFHDLFED